MNTSDALDIREALATLAKALNMKMGEVARNVCFLDDNKIKIMVEACNRWTAFECAGLETRARMLGVSVTMPVAEEER